MTDIKIDTFRSSVYDKEFSGSETESETIDDFSQYSDQMNNVISDKSLNDSHSTTPISKVIPIKINGNDNQIHLHDYLDSSLNEEKDTSEDLMVQISKKTTIKKIISKTTLVNGVKQASEFEEYIIHDSHSDGNTNKSKCDKFYKNQTNLDFEQAMNGNYLNGTPLDKSRNENDCCIDETIEATKAHSSLHGRTIYDKSSESSISETNEKSKIFLLSKENNIEKFQTHMPQNEQEINNKNPKIQENSNSGKINENINEIQHQNLNENENNNKGEHSIISEPITTSQMKEKNLNKSNNRVSILKNDKTIEKNQKINTNINDLNNNMEMKNDKRHFIYFKSQDPHKTDYKFHNRNDYIHDKQKFTMYKRSEKDNLYKNDHQKNIDECDNIKSKSLQSKTQFHDRNNKKIDTETAVKHMKWVDPFRSYHLKYDLKDNGRSMQHWIRRKQDALYRSDPKNNVENSIGKKGIKCRSTNFAKSYSKVSHTHKSNSQKDIKEFIIRGNIKESLFQIRHPYPTFAEQEHIFYSPTNKRASEYFEFNEDIDFESLGFYNLNQDELKPKQRLLDSKKGTRNNLSNEVSQILNKFETQEKGMQQKSKNLRERRNDEEMTYTHRNCHLPVSCCINSCCYSTPCSCLFRKGKVFERYKYLSYERVGENVKGECQATEYYEDSETSETHTYIEKKIDNKSKRSNKIDYLEAQLEQIEDKIRNINSNGEKSVFQCTMDLECQCREIERELEYLYRVPRSIREAA